MSEHDAAITPETAMWSTQAEDPDTAVDYWRAVRLKAHVDVAPAPYGPDFAGEVSYADYGDFALSVKRASGKKVSRSRALISRGAEDRVYLYASIRVLFHRRHSDESATRAIECGKHVGWRRTRRNRFT